MKNIKNKILAGVGAVAGYLGLTLSIAKADVLSSSTLGTAIDNTSSTWYDYFLVFLAHAWPFILGASVLVGLVVLAIAMIRRIFHG